jgi:hypothetical protein
MINLKICENKVIFFSSPIEWRVRKQRIENVFVNVLDKTTQSHSEELQFSVVRSHSSFWIM